MKPEYNFHPSVKVHFGIRAEHEVVGRVNEKFYRGVNKLIVHEKYDLKG